MSLMSMMKQKTREREVAPKIVESYTVPESFEDMASCGYGRCPEDNCYPEDEDEDEDEDGYGNATINTDEIQDDALYNDLIADPSEECDYREFYNDEHARDERCQFLDDIFQREYDAAGSWID